MADVIKNLWDIHNFLEQQLDKGRKIEYLKQQNTPMFEDPESFHI